MFAAERNEEFELAHMMPLIIDEEIKNKKETDYFKKIVDEIHGITSGELNWFKVDHKIYSVVSIAVRMNPDLFKEEIPKNALPILRDLFAGYDKWIADEKLKADTIQQESEKMHKVLELMRRELDKGANDFRISFIRPNRFYIHPMNKDGETMDVDLTFKKNGVYV
jgi:hypothetical protein